MNASLSQSIFTVEVDWKPVFAFATRKQADAEAICADARIRDKLRALKSGGRPLLEDLGNLRVRLARPDERAVYHKKLFELSSSGFVIVYLVELDQMPSPSVADEQDPQS